MNAKNRTTALLGAGFALLFLAAGTARGDHDTLSDRGYQQMRQFAHELDEQAQHANDQAQHQGVWFYGHDPRFLRSINSFANRANRFHDRMDDYRTAPWQVDDELRLILRDARAVQYRLRRSRNADRHTVGDWNQVVILLNQMIRVYQSDLARNQYGAPEPQYRDEHVAPPAGSGYYSNDRSNDRYEVGRPEGRGYDREQVAALAHELAERSARLSSLTSQLTGRYRDDEGRRGTVEAIEHFAQQADAFHERYERGLSPEDVRGNVDHLWQDGREADRQFRQMDIPELRSEWAGMMQLLSRLRSGAGF
ncbi:MAG: hypothetical protein LC796_06110 [Acidobacteria bacterium]|nr:hypothetical protein [Acidobacteriota bacterium]MCA1611079.1 hypothetical protein [Acidobacteriota bacterium]